MMARIHLLILLVASLLASLVAAEAPVFCKCTCFKNSTIIPLSPSTSKPTPDLFFLPRSPSALSLPESTNTDINSSNNIPGALQRRVPPPSCYRCTKNFCLNQGIDFCQKAKEPDVQTQCFQRDSNKDKAIIWMFLVGTAGLLGWAAYKRYQTMRERGVGAPGVVAREEYARLSTVGGQ